MESFEKEIVPFIIDPFARLSSLLASSLPPFFLTNFHYYCLRVYCYYYRALMFRPTARASARIVNYLPR